MFTDGLLDYSYFKKIRYLDFTLRASSAVCPDASKQCFVFIFPFSCRVNISCVDEEEIHHAVMGRNAFERNDVKHNRAARSVKVQSSIRPVNNLRQLLFMWLFFGREAISNNFPTHVKVHTLELCLLC